MAKDQQTKKEPDEQWKDTSRPAPDRVLSWLSKEGTPLEFATAAEFAKAGFQIAQGIHQPQPDGLPLEIDVVAYSYLKGQSTRLGHDLIIECKNAPNPWVAFAPLEKNEPIDRPIETDVLEAARFVLKRRKLSVPRVWPEAPRAFGLKSLHRGGERDNAYEAMLGVVARARLRNGSFQGKSWHHTHMPMVVVGGELCMAEWDESAKEVRVRSIEACIVDFRGDSVLHSSEVQVVTLSALRAWLPSLKTHVEARAGVLGGVVDEVAHALNEDSLAMLGLSSDDRELPGILKQVAKSEQTTQMLREQNERIVRGRRNPMEGM